MVEEMYEPSAETANPVDESATEVVVKPPARKAVDELADPVEETAADVVVSSILSLSEDSSALVVAIVFLKFSSLELESLLTKGRGSKLNPGRACKLSPALEPEASSLSVVSSESFEVSSLLLVTSAVLGMASEVEDFDET